METYFLQDILTFRVVCARINRPSIPPAHLHWPDCCSTIRTTIGRIRPPSTSRLYASHHTILAITISCKGQTETHNGRRGVTKRLAEPRSHRLFHTHIYIHIGMHTYTHTCTYPYIPMYICICIYTCMYVCYSCIYIYMSIAETQPAHPIGTQLGCQPLYPL